MILSNNISTCWYKSRSRDHIKEASKIQGSPAHWISPKAEIIAVAVEDEHFEAAQEIVAERYPQDYKRIMRVRSLEETCEDFLYKKEWVRERWHAFYCERFNQRIRDNIFTAALGLGYKKITVEFANKIILWEQVPEMLYEHLSQKWQDYDRSCSFIDSGGKEHVVGFEQHLEFAKNLADPVDDRNPIVQLLMKDWIRRFGNAFETYRTPTGRQRDFIFMISKREKYDLIYVDTIQDGIFLSNDSPEMLYEQQRNESSLLEIVKKYEDMDSAEKNLYGALVKLCEQRDGSWRINEFRVSQKAREKKIRGEYQKVCMLTNSHDLLREAHSMVTSFQDAVRLINMLCSSIGVTPPKTKMISQSNRVEYYERGTVHLRPITTIGGTIHELAHHIVPTKVIERERTYTARERYWRELAGFSDHTGRRKTWRRDVHSADFVKKLDELLVEWKKLICGEKAAASEPVLSKASLLNVLVSKLGGEWKKINKFDRVSYRLDSKRFSADIWSDEDSWRFTVFNNETKHYENNGKVKTFEIAIEAIEETIKKVQEETALATESLISLIGIIEEK